MEEVDSRLERTMKRTYHEVVGTDVASALTTFASAERATQLVLGASRRNRWAEVTRGSVINAVTRQARSFDVHVIAEESEDDGRALPRRRERTVARDLLARSEPPAGW